MFLWMVIPFLVRQHVSFRCSFNPAVVNIGKHQNLWLPLNVSKYNPQRVPCTEDAPTWSEKAGEEQGMDTLKGETEEIRWGHRHLDVPYTQMYNITQELPIEIGEPPLGWGPR